MWKVGVEGHAVAGGELVAGAVADEGERAALDEARLAAPGLVHGRVAGPAGAGARLEAVAGDLGPLTGQRRGEDGPAGGRGAPRGGGPPGGRAPPGPPPPGAQPREA